MPYGEEKPTTLIMPSQTRERERNRARYVEWMKHRQYVIMGVIGFVFLVCVATLILSGTEKAQINDVSNELKGIEKKLDEQNLQLKHANGGAIPTARQLIRCEDVRFSGMTETTLLEHDFADDIVENGVFLSNRWVCGKSDGTASLGLSVNSNPFKNSIDEEAMLQCNHDEADNLKYFCNSQNSFVVSTNTTRAIKIEAEMTGKVYCSAKNNSECRNDPRVATIVFSTWDEETQMQNDIWLTNTTIYAVHWKRMALKKRDYTVRAYVYPIQRRKSAEQKHVLALTYRKNTLQQWSVVFGVDGYDQFTLFHLGIAQNAYFQTLNDGTIANELLSPKRLRIGFGSASYMQMENPDHRGSTGAYFDFPCNKQNIKEQSLFGNATTTTNIFQQGAAFSITKVRVSEYK